MSVIVAVVTGALCVLAALNLVWLIQLRTRNAGMVDPVWSWSLGFLGVWFALFGGAPPQLRILLALLSGLWGLRLGVHLFNRNFGKPEDRRYALFRQQWGLSANRNMFWFFQLQAVLALLLALGFLVVAYRPDTPGVLAIALSVLIWLASVIGEALADWQLEKFKQDPASKTQVCRRGLWNYSRHPNYFFECLHWIAYLPLAFGAPWWWLALLPPVLMAYLLLKLSGVPMVEAQSAQSRPGYSEYVRTTSMLIPWPPRHRRE